MLRGKKEVFIEEEVTEDSDNLVVKDLATSKCSYCGSTEFEDTKEHDRGTLQLCICGKWSLNTD